MARHSARKTAKKETFEEAGIIGKVAKEPVGEFLSYKGMGNGFKVRTNIVVYPLKFEQQVEEFPEAGQRELIWLPLSQAANACQEEGLCNLLQSTKVKTLLINQK